MAKWLKYLVYVLIGIVLLAPASKTYAEGECEESICPPCNTCVEKTYSINIELKINGVAPMKLVGVKLLTTEGDKRVYLNELGQGSLDLDMRVGILGIVPEYEHDEFYVRGIYTKYGGTWSFPMTPVVGCNSYTFLVDIQSITIDGKPFPEPVQTEPESPISNGDIYSDTQYGNNNNSGVMINDSQLTNVTIGDTYSTTTVSNTTFVYVTNYVTVEQQARKEMKKLEPKAPISIPPAPKPLLPTGHFVPRFERPWFMSVVLWDLTAPARAVQVYFEKDPYFWVILFLLALGVVFFANFLSGVSRGANQR